MINMNMIKTELITNEDIKIAKISYEPDLGCIKQKTTRNPPNPVVEDYNEITE
jgi:hypothetical protein